jgi:hypothetical protein
MEVTTIVVISFISSVLSMDTLTKYRELLISKVKLKYGLSVYNNKQSFFDLLIDKYINCKYFDDFIDLGDCGDKQVVLRVYEACNIPQYDPHVNGDSRHLHFCKAAYGAELVHITEIVETKLLGNIPYFLMISILL